MSTHMNFTRRAFFSAFATGALAVAGCAAGDDDQGEQTTDAAATDSTTSVDDMPWWKKTIVYEAYPKSFQSSQGRETGDIAGVTSRLDYLKELGVGAIWLTPVFVSPMADNGYDVADYYDIDPSFGTMEDMDELMAEAADRDIKIVLDMVVNHTSNKNAWFVESSSSKDNRIDAHSWELVELKDALSATQANTATNGWCPVFFENHDQPRCVVSFFPEGSDTDLAAKCMATVQLGLRGTPFVYEGQELGFSNVAWPSIDDYNDPSSHNQYEAAIAKGHTKEEALACVHRFSRDNARTPMQWDASENAGFTTDEKTWLPVHDDYETQNAELESEQDTSVLNYFRAMAKLREDNDVLLAGSYEEIAHDHKQIYAYVRELEGVKLLVMANFTNEEAPLNDLAKQISDTTEVIMSSYDDEPVAASALRPLEARICEL